MDPRWGLVVLAAVCLLQLPAVLLLARRVATPEDLPWRPEFDGPPEPAHRSAPRPPAAPARCPGCGAANDPSYAYCRQCVASL